MKKNRNPSLPDLDQLIIARAADAIIYADCRGTIRRWNAAAERLFGFSAGEAIGHSLDLIIPERLRAAHWRGFDAAIASGATRLSGRPAVTRATHQSGQPLYVEMSFAVVNDADGAALGAVAIARDAAEKTKSRPKAAF